MPRRPGFTLFEALVAMFIMLIGLLGIVSVFSGGMQARLLAQELVVSQELANMWAEWIRFRLNENSPAGAPFNALSPGDLGAGKRGDFFSDTGDFNAAPGDPANLPTYRRSAYRGYLWEITAVNANYNPEWLTADGTRTIPWDQRLDGGPVQAAPAALREVELTVGRGTRRYRFYYVFSGVGLRYGKL